MGSIPHGTTINAQCPVPTATIAGTPVISPTSITPFVVGQPQTLVQFANTNANDQDTARLPQDLTKFIAAGTITQAMLTDPNTVGADSHHFLLALTLPGPVLGHIVQCLFWTKS